MSSPLRMSRTGTMGSPAGNDTERSFYGNEVEVMNAVEQSKRMFLQSFGDYIESVKRTTETAERQNMQGQFEQRLADNCKKALGTAASDALAPPASKVEYKHLPSLIENAKSYTTSPKYAEWQTGINNSLPLLEEAFNKLRVLDIPTAEKDIIDPVRTAVNTPFMQMIKCKDKQRELHGALTQGMVETTYAGHVKSLYNEFQANHKERKVRQALELVKRMETAVQAADANFTQRLDSYVEAKKLMNVPVDQQNPLSLQDYDPIRDKALASLDIKLSEVLQVKSVWEADLEGISKASKADDMLEQLKNKAQLSSDAHRRAEGELKMSTESVQRAWDALIEAQQKAVQAEKTFIATKLQEEMDSKMVAAVTTAVEVQKARFVNQVESCNTYCEVLRLVQKYISARWEPFRDVVKNDSKSLVVEVCEVFSVSEKVLGDLIDRKQAQMDHAAKEEKDCLEKYHRKWDQLDPNADQEKARAHEAQAVKETAEREVERLGKLRQGMREVLHRCRRVIEYFGISVDAIERGALIEEWDKKRVRVYKEFEDMIESCVVRINVMGQTPDAQLNEIKAAAQEEYKRLNAFLLGIPDVIAAPLGCHGQAGVDEKQRITVGDMIMRVEYMCKELDRHGTSHAMLQSGLARLKQLNDSLKTTRLPATKSAEADASTGTTAFA